MTYKFKLKSYFCNLYSGSESFYLYIGKAFLLRGLNIGTLLYSICLPRRIAS